MCLNAYTKLPLSIFKQKTLHTELKLLCFWKALMTGQQDTSQQIIL